MKLQEIFDTVVRHLLEQKQMSITPERRYKADEAGVCMYRGEGGLKCAVGALISDRYYNPNMEGFLPSDNNVQSALVKSGVLDASESNDVRRDKVKLLSELQSVHDSFYAREDWPWSRTVTKLKERANHYRLTWPEGVPLA